jgi:cell division protein FtsZ
MEVRDHTPEAEVPAPPSSRLLIAGLGGGGSNMVAHMDTAGWADVERVLVHTDAQALSAYTHLRTVQIGVEVTRGLSAGGDAEKGRRAAEADTDTLSGLFHGVDMAFLVTGLGGGTGTGALPVLVDIARSRGVPAICYATLPFTFEGSLRTRQAMSGLLRLKKTADVILVQPNPSLFSAAEKESALGQAFAQADRSVGKSLYALWRLLFQRGLINLDFADLRQLAVQYGDTCTMAVAEQQGPDRLEQVTRNILEHPVLEDRQRLKQSPAMVVGVSGGNDMTLTEVEHIMQAITQQADPNADIRMGTAIDSTRREWLMVTILLTEGREKRAPTQAVKPETAPAASAQPPGPAATAASDSNRAARKKKKAEQTRLDLDSTGKGRFKDVEPTLYEGEDLDVPTFKRRGIRLKNNHG